MAATHEVGPLETEILHYLWDHGEVAVEEVHRRLQVTRPVAYTTVMTVMSRLTARGLLERRKEGRAYFYRTVVDRNEVAGGAVRHLVERFFGGRAIPAIHCLLGVTPLNEADLSELQRLVSDLAGREE
ncbi:MAG: BlaI/MecI/CopY family transcriptional regulator [Mycobacterium leprae]